MPQAPLSGIVSNGSQQVSSGTIAALNVTAAKVIKVGAGRVATICNNAGVAGFTINDCATTAAAGAANVILIGGTTVIGQVFKLDIPFTTGLVISVVGSAGNLTISYT